MLVILTEKEVHEAIQASLGSEYTVNDIKIIAGRGRNATRVEVEVDKAAVSTPKSVTESAETTPTETSVTGPIFDTTSVGE